MSDPIRLAELFCVATTIPYHTIGGYGLLLSDSECHHTTHVKRSCRFLDHSGCSYTVARKRTVLTQLSCSITTSYASRWPVSPSAVTGERDCVCNGGHNARFRNAGRSRRPRKRAGSGVGIRNSTTTEVTRTSGSLVAGHLASGSLRDRGYPISVCPFRSVSVARPAGRYGSTRPRSNSIVGRESFSYPVLNVSRTRTTP